LLALTVGDRASQAQAVMSFIVTEEIMLIGMFAPVSLGSGSARQAARTATVSETKRRD
jgi:hypothetical protein